MNIREVRNPENDNQIEWLIPAVLTHVPETFDLKLKNAKQTPYAIVQAKIVYDDGSEQIVDSRLYEASATANAGRFVKDATIDLRMQMEGEYEGRSVVQLPGASKTDLTKLLSLKSQVQGSELAEKELATSL